MPKGFQATGQVIALSGGTAGATKACILCHGLKGQGDGHESPRLAGLDEGYLLRQLIDYVNGKRHNKVMADIARQLTADERAKVARYYEGLPQPTPAQCTTPVEEGEGLYQQGDARRGIAACAACHGSLGEGVGSANPPLAHQPAAYISTQLKRWQRGERQGDAGGVMLSIARALSASEISAVAAYASCLPGSDPLATPAAWR
jgi:cytochrome c553